MEKIRWPDDWTTEEKIQAGEIISSGRTIYNYTRSEDSIVQTVTGLLKIATSPPPRREIDSGTIVHVSDDEGVWQADGYEIWFYGERDKYGKHQTADGFPWKYARPVAPGWKPGDPLDPPNEGDL